MVSEQHEQADEPPSTRSLLDWHRTHNDPFKEVWELIAAWVLARPERTSGEILRELQRLFPGRYQPSHLRTLQRGVRKIRARLRATVVVQWQEEVIHAEPDLTSPQRPEQEASKTDVPVRAVALPPTHDLCRPQTRGHALPSQRPIKKEARPSQRTETGGVGEPAPVVSAWASENGVLLGQRKVAEKSNEITAIPALLEQFYLAGCIVTIDAMGCQTDIASTIIKQHADDVLVLKGNQGQLHADVQEWFEWAKQSNFADMQ
jgi:hypothetical protein